MCNVEKNLGVKEELFNHLKFEVKECIKSIVSKTIICVKEKVCLIIEEIVLETN